MVATPNIDRWLDLDLDAEARKVGKLTGCKPRTSSLGAERPILEDKYADEVIPYEKLPEIISQKDFEASWLAEMITRIFDQDGEGACVSDAIMGCHEVVQCKEVGPARVVHMSAMSVYHWVARSAQSGSNLDENLDQIKTVGALPLDNAENKLVYKHYHPNIGFNTKFMDEWEETAGLFKDLEDLDIRGPEGFWTAVCKGWPVMFARDGHCIFCPKLIWSVPKKQLIIPYCNSWHISWGDRVNEILEGGMGYDSYGKMQNYANGSIAFRQVKTPVAA